MSIQLSKNLISFDTPGTLGRCYQISETDKITHIVLPQEEAFQLALAIIKDYTSYLVKELERYI